MNRRLFRAAIAGILAVFFLSPPVRGDDPSFDSGLVFGRITFDRHDVFDTGDTLDERFPYTWANKIHVVTKESYLANELLFREGDPYDPFLVEESERILRKQYLHRFVKIVPQPPVNGRVDVCVHTEDVWTTSVRASYRAAGGENLYKFGLLEQNLWGRGIKIGGFAEQDIDRFKSGLRFEDPNFLSTPYEFSAGYGKDEKGREYTVRMVRPYDSVLDRHSEGVAAHVSDDEDRLFENGDEIARFRHEEKILRTHAGLAWRPNRNRTLRWRVTHHLDEDRFFDGVFLRPRPVPVDRTVSAALIGVDYGAIRFTEETGVLTFDRDEDINLGWEWSWEMGPSLEALGATRDGAIGRGGVQKNWRWTSRVYLFSLAELSGRLEKGRVQNGEAEVRAHAVARHWWNRNTATLTTEFKKGRNLDPEVEYLVGGENGLRGYPVRHLSGSKTLLVQLENRRVVLYDWLNLLNVGWAVFFDAGGVRLRDLKSDVGAGIRFSPTRSVSAAIIRLDLAYALDDNDKDSRWVANIGAFFAFGPPEKRKFDF